MKALLKRAGAFRAPTTLPWGYGGSGAAKNVASAPLIDLGALGLRDYVYLPGLGGRYISTPDTPDLRITGDLDLRVHGRIGATLTSDAWIGRSASASQRSFLFGSTVNGRIILNISENGSTEYQFQSDTGVVAADQDYAYRVALDVDNGSGQSVATFYRRAANDGAWAPIGSHVRTGTLSPFAGTSALQVGDRTDLGRPVSGRIFSAEVRSGIDGPVVARFDASDGEHGDTSIVSGGRTWTLNGSGSELRTAKTLWLPGTAGNYVSTPDVNEIDYDSSTFENGVGRWEGLNKNLLTAGESSFDANAASWMNYSNCSVARSTAVTGFAGSTGVLAVTATAAGSATARNSTIAAGANLVPVTAGQVYTMMAHVRAATVARSVRVGVRWVTSGYGAPGGDLYGDPTADHAAGWTQASAVLQAPADAAYALVFVQFMGCAAGEVHYVDAVGLFETPNGNLVANPDFEDGIAGYSSPNGGTVAHTSERAFLGRSAAKVTLPAIGVAGSGLQISIPSALNLQPNTTYTVSAWVYVPATGVDVQFSTQGAGYSTPINVLQQASAKSTVKDSWTRIFGTFTTAASGTTALYILNATTSTAGQIFYVDAFQVVVGSAPVEYLPPTTTNLIQNPSFETSIAGWILEGGIGTGSVAHSTARSFVGTGSLLVTATGSGTLAARQSSGAIPVTPGDVLTGSAYVWSPVAATFRLLFLNRGPGNSWIGASSTSDVAVAANTWTRLSLSASVLAGAATTEIRVDRTLATSGDYFHVDAAQVEYGSVATPFVDGSLGAGYGWDSSENLISNSSFEADAAGWEGINKNLLTANQSSLETDTSGYIVAGSTLARSTAQSLTGAGSLEITSTGGSTAGFSTSSGGHAPVMGGQVYTFVASFRAATVARSIRVDHAWNDANNVRLGSPGYVAGSVLWTDHTAGWTQVVVTLQAPESARFLQLVPLVVGAANGEVHYVDAVGLFETPNGNLVPGGGDFENGIAGWSGNGTVTHDTTEAYTGRGSIKVVSPGTNSGPFVNLSGLIPGATYTASLYAKGTGDAQISARTGNHSATYAVSPLVALTSTWTRAVVTFTPTQTDLALYFRMNTAGTVYVDAVQLVVGSVPVDYLPPATTNLSPNPSLGVDATGWTASLGVGGASTRGTDASGPPRATYFRISPVAAYNAIQFPLYYSGTSGPQTISFWARSTGANRHWGMQDTGRNATLPGSGSLLMDDGSIAPNNRVHADGVWRRYRVTFVPSGGEAANSRVGIKDLSGTDGAGTTLDVTGLQWEYGSVATPYVDGALGAGYSWDSSENLLSSSHAEGLGGFGGQNSTLTFGDTAWSVSGGSSMRVSSSSTADSAANYGGIKLDPLTTYTISATINVPVAQTGTLDGRARKIVLYAGSAPGSTVTTSYGESAAGAATGVTRLTRTFTTNSVDLWLYFRLYNGAAVGAGDVLWDAIQVERGSVATPFGQTGTAHASTSTRRVPWVLGGTSLESPTRLGGGVANASGGIAAQGSSNLLVALNGKVWNPSTYQPGVETRVAVAPNATYALSAQIAYSGTTAVLRVLDAATGALLGTSAASNGGAWSRRVVMFTTSGTTTSVRVQWVQMSFAAQDIYLDAVQLEQRSVATPYGQVGTANASTSTRRLPWVLGGTSIEGLTRVTFGAPQQGTAHMLVQTNAGQLLDHTGNLYGVRYGILSASASTTYTLTLLTQEGRAQVRVVDATTGAVLGTSSLTTSSGSTLRTVTFTTGATTTGVVVYVLRVPGGFSNFYVDRVQLERGSTATPYTLPTRITGDIDLRAHVALEDWTPAGNASYIVGTWGESGTTKTYFLAVISTGAVRLYYSLDGTTTSFVDSTIPTGALDGAALYVRATRAQATGQVQFFTSSDGSTWTALGAAVSTPVGPLHASVGRASIGAQGYLDTAGWHPKGKVLSAEVRAGIAGTVVARYDSTEHSTDTFADARGRTWSIARSGDATAEIVDRNTWAFTGTEYLTLPDRAAFDFGTGQDFTALIRSLSREGNVNDNRFGRNAVNGQWSAYSGWGNTVICRVQDSGGAVASTIALAQPPGAWGLHAAGRTGTTLHSRINGGTPTTTADTTSGNLVSADHIFVGYSTRGLISWVALFRRTLTVTEHAELAAWDGRIATEPVWLRTAATVYLNADDPAQREAYRTSNTIINLASQMQVKAKLAGAWTTGGSYRKVNGAWELIA